MTLQDYKIVLYRQEDASWVAEVPAVPGCYALMDTREEALAELSRVFDMISEEYREKDSPSPRTAPKSSMPSATAREFQAVARKLGFEPRRQTGSHERWNHPDGRAVTSPLHKGKEIGPPLFFKILRPLGATLEEFQQLR